MIEPLRDSEEICEALVRHTEVSGSEVFSKNFVSADKDDDGRVICTVWCVIGDNAQAFDQMVDRWLDDNGFTRDS